MAIRTLALEREELIAQGRKVVCPDQRLVCEPVPLALARHWTSDDMGDVSVFWVKILEGKVMRIVRFRMGLAWV